MSPLLLLEEFEEAKHDKFVVSTLLEKEQIDGYSEICYHIQQSIEKCLKALIVMRGGERQSTNDIMKLVDKTFELYPEIAFDLILRNVADNATMFTAWWKNAKSNVHFKETKNNVDLGIATMYDLLDVVEILLREVK